ncbi:unnamed protein product [Brassica rapa]|uniref:Uncharacterized protein n=1 Tax=Brassica campestris TaxID=3711 RepID=A0A3P6BQB6_BRACM|nr:unnamed protein product [Brassica rapa]VDD01135.1 unnamed protein product [Brassica rapa]
MADLSLAQGRGRGEVGVVRFPRSVFWFCLREAEALSAPPTPVPVPAW